MTQTAQTIGSKEGTYQERLLSFVNTEELISRMDEVVEELKNEYEAAVKASSSSEYLLEKERLNSIKSDYQDNYETNQKRILELTEILEELKEKKPDAEKLKKDDEERNKIIQNIVPVETKLSTTFNAFNEKGPREGFELVYTHILYGLISKKNGTSKVPEKEKVLANSYDLLGIIESFKDKLSSDSIDVLGSCLKIKLIHLVNLIRARITQKSLRQSLMNTRLHRTLK